MGEGKRKRKRKTKKRRTIKDKKKKTTTQRYNFVHTYLCNATQWRGIRKYHLSELI